MKLGQERIGLGGEAAIALIPELAKVSDYTIIQREVPWTRILAGTPMETVYDEEYRGVVEYLRDVNGLRRIVLEQILHQRA